MYRNGNLAIAIYKGIVVQIKYLRPRNTYLFLNKIRKYFRVIKSKNESYSMFLFNLCIFCYLTKSLMSFYRYVTSISLLFNDCQYLNFPSRSHVYLENICSGQSYNVRLLTFLTISKCCIFNSIDGCISGMIKYYKSFILHSNQ